MEGVISIIDKIFQKIQKEERIPQLFYKARIMITKQNKDNMRKKQTKTL